MPAQSTFPNQHTNNYHYSSYTQAPFSYAQQWPHNRPSDDHSDPRSLSSDTSMSMSASASAAMSPVSSQDESVALPAKAVCPAATAKPVEEVRENARAQCLCDWGEYARPQRQWDVNVNVRQGAESPRRDRLSVYSDSGEEDEDEEDDKESENAFVVLLRLSFLAPPFSLIAALYTLVVLLFLVITTPIRLFFSSIKPTCPFSTQILHLLLPLLHRHKRLITTLTPSQSRRQRHPYHRTTPSPSETTTSYSPTRLILIHLLSPLLILPILFAAWIAASFWVFAMILGNPDGTERRDDGRAAVLGVRNWWRIWLRKAGRTTNRGEKGPEMTQTADAAARV